MPVAAVCHVTRPRAAGARIVPSGHADGERRGGYDGSGEAWERSRRGRIFRYLRIRCQAAVGMPRKVAKNRVCRTRGSWARSAICRRRRPSRPDDARFISGEHEPVLDGAEEESRRRREHLLGDADGQQRHERMRLERGGVSLFGACRRSTPTGYDGSQGVASEIPPRNA